MARQKKSSRRDAVVITKKDFLAANPEIQKSTTTVSLDYVEEVPRLHPPSGTYPLGPSSWMTLVHYDRIIEMRDEIFPSPCCICFGDPTVMRIRKDLKIFRENVPLNLTKDGEKQMLRKYMLQSIREYLDIPWHEWMFPIGPITCSVGPKRSGQYLQFSVCWADILILVHTKGYLTRFMDFYDLILELHSEGISMMVCKDQVMMVQRWLHVLSSIGIHIQCLEILEARVGGNWTADLKRLRDIRIALSTELNVNLGLMDHFCSKVSIKAIENPRTASCGNSTVADAFKYAYRLSEPCP